MLTVIAGVHEERPAAETAARFPGATISRIFISGTIAPQDLRPDFDTKTRGLRGNGRTCYVSFKPIPADVAAGGWDAHLRNLGVWLAANPGVKVIVNHEPENDMAGATFAAMFNRVRAGIKAGHADAVVVYCAMSYQWRPGGKAAVEAASWAKTVADEYLVDVYSGKSFPDNTILPNHPGFTGWYQAIVAPKVSAGQDVVWGLGERGFQSTSSSTRASTIRAEKAWLLSLRHVGAYLPCSVYLGWNTPGRENDPAWVFDAAAEKAMGELVTALVALNEPALPPALTDRYQEGYDAGYVAGAASREADVLLAKQDGYALGEAAGRRAGARAAYDDTSAYTAGKAAQLA